MARPGLLRHRKFIRLARSLDAFAFGELHVRGLGQSLAAGSLELLWNACYENQEDVVGGPDDVEMLAAWNGPAGFLFAALRDAGQPDKVGFIEEDPERPGIWRVHDLWDHAPEYVSRQMKRKIEREQNGETISALRASAGRKGGLARAAKMQASGKQAEATCLANVATPGPARPNPARHQQPAASADASPPSPAVAVLACVGDGPKEYVVTEAQVAEWRPAYPGVDVAGEVRRAKQWLDANPTKRKTHRGCPSFLVRWLARAQDSGRPGREPPKPVTAPANEQAAFQGGRRVV